MLAELAFTLGVPEVPPFSGEGIRLPAPAAEAEPAQDAPGLSATIASTEG